jgi:hypothetical protein
MPVFAQDPEIVTKMETKLSLTQDQVTAITPIVEKYSSKREELRQNVKSGSMDRDSIRGQMKEMKADEKQELSQVLSAKQLSQWEQGGGNGNGSGGGEQ